MKYSIKKLAVTTSCAALVCAGIVVAKKSPTTKQQTPKQANSMIKTASGLEYRIIKPAPAGAQTAKAGNTVTVHYKGTLTNGQEFDSSRRRGTPFSFHLGSGMVIKGWDEGVAGMHVGEVRELVIPASLGYGNRGVGSIPGGATLIFEVELLGVK
jgi:FKBP-type peptidyl-prolyl cis-trans isomerase